jgi:predicted phosphodiesterase
LRVAIISDIHANLPAFETVLKHMGSVEAIWCLGDLVGYGPQPNECISALRERAHICVPGNHDWGALGKLDLGAFNRDARSILEWTHSVLTPENSKYLDELPVQQVVKWASCTLVHASPRDPMWEYLLDLFDAAECFPLFSTRYCFLGHTHVPLIFLDVAGTVKAAIPEHDESISLDIRPYSPNHAEHEGDEGGPRMIINPGSVGQPRDRDPRAAYMMLELPDDPETSGWQATLTFWRVPYPVEETQALMKKMGFPPRLISRLEMGV